MAKETGISRIEHISGGIRVQGVHKGVPSDFLVPTAHLDAERQKGGEKGVREYLERNLDGGRVDRVYNPHTGELLRGGD